MESSVGRSVTEISEICWQKRVVNKCIFLYTISMKLLRVLFSQYQAFEPVFGCSSGRTILKTKAENTIKTYLNTTYKIERHACNYCYVPTYFDFYETFVSRGSIRFRKLVCLHTLNKHNHNIRNEKDKEIGFLRFPPNCKKNQAI